MDGENAHLHEFEVQNKIYSSKDLFGAYGTREKREKCEEADVRLRDLFK